MSNAAEPGPEPECCGVIFDRMLGARWRCVLWHARYRATTQPAKSSRNGSTMRGAKAYATGVYRRSPREAVLGRSFLFAAPGMRRPRGECRVAAMLRRHEFWGPHEVGGAQARPQRL